MKLATLTAALKRKAALGLLKTQKHSPTILFFAGAVGIVTTAVLTARATLKVSDGLDATAEILDEIEHGEGTDREKMEAKMLVYGKLTVYLAKAYTPAIITGTLSLAALGGAHYIQIRRLSALGTAYLAVDRSFKSYRERVRGEVGESRELELFQDRRVVDTIIEDGKPVEVKVPSGVAPYSFLWDETNRNWNPDYRYNAMFLQSQQNFANQRLQAYGYIFLNDVLDSLGIPRTPEGQIVGWFMGNGDDHVDFGIFDGDTYMATQFINGNAPGIWLTFNVDGPIWRFI
jgi:hypothetical protein